MIGKLEVSGEELGLIEKNIIVSFTFSILYLFYFIVKYDKFKNLC